MGEGVWGVQHTQRYARNRALQVAENHVLSTLRNAAERRSQNDAGEAVEGVRWMTSAKRRKLTDPAYNDDRRASVAQALLHLATRVQPDACEGCGHDRSCASRGCNIILTASDLEVTGCARQKKKKADKE